MDIIGNPRFHSSPATPPCAVAPEKPQNESGTHFPHWCTETAQSLKGQVQCFHDFVEERGSLVLVQPGWLETEFSLRRQMTGVKPARGQRLLALTPVGQGKT